MSEPPSLDKETHALEGFSAELGKNDQLTEDRCAKLVTTLESCERQLSDVRLELTELQRTGPREGFAQLKSNRNAIEHKMENVGSLVFGCAASWKSFASQIEPLDRKRLERRHARLSSVRRARG